MAGRIRDEDIALVRERVRIDEVIEQHVTLRNAGGGSRKGLCPFHDEKSPSFNVTPSRGMYYCFGCGAGGDAFTFLQEVEGITFTEAVERLAGRVGVQLRYVDGAAGPRRDPNQRARLVEANRVAAAYFVDQLTASSDARTGRQFLTDRGFDRAAAETFGVGFAPRGGEALLAHLRAAGFSDDELLKAGLVAQGSRGSYDRFRGRLIWPIRDVSGDVVGFGARRLFDDDRIEAKYLNTPETPIYKKSQVLYGVDLARRPISRASQAVVVEGYTDVMACHEAGVTTAIATCGTAFGTEHARILRRLMLDHDEFRGEVIFTFDGDEAGQNAAMRAFEGDQQFVAQTYVAVEPAGLDPCDLRLQQGDASVRELIAKRVPLYRFVLANVARKYDLDRADQRVDATAEAARLVAAIRDRSKVEAFAREIASTIGVDVEDVRAHIRAAGQRGSAPAPQRERAEVPPDAPSLGDERFADERELLQAVVQYPHVAADRVEGLDVDDFTHPVARAVWELIEKNPPLPSSESAWVPGLRDAAADDATRRVLAALATQPLRTNGDVEATLMSALVARLQELTTRRRIEELKSRLQRTNPVDEATEYNRMFGELVALEQQRRTLRERAVGTTT
ncbi:DNA primase [Solicola gregarius]|uniref:DNA primase n=1 Tax=Solicola gregarius TaxID=2908642 RepID=A0AA46TIC0_9ACTN|nr:DNA primase [Solicola gregarius]UYM05688.1 DNA primase [Solicola gregarius]